MTKSLKILLCLLVLGVVAFGIYKYYEYSKTDNYVTLTSYPMDDTSTIQYADGNIEYIEDSSPNSPGYGQSQQIVGSSRIMSSLGS